MAESMEGDGHSARFNACKHKGHVTEDLRRRRVGTSVELRKQKKDETLVKRRNMDAIDEEPRTPLKKNKKKETWKLSAIISGMKSSDHTQVMKATETLRKILSRQKNPPVEQMVEAGVVKLLVNFLNFDDRSNLQNEAAWALTNIASGTSKHTHMVVEAGAVPQFIRLLQSPATFIVEQCVWALGNIAGDGPDLRDVVLRCGTLPPLLRLVTMGAQPNFLRIVTWTISNLCRNKFPSPSMTTITACLPALGNLIHHTDNGVLSEVCSALSYATDGSSNRIQSVIDFPGMLARLVMLLGSPELSVVLPALRTIGNIVTGDDSQTQAVIDANAVPFLSALLQHPKFNVKKEACWVLSNITASSTEQIQAVINCNVLPLLVEVLITGDFNSQKEACWVISNLAIRGTVDQISCVIEAGALKPLCALLTAKDISLLHILLDGIVSILEAAERVGHVGPLCLLLEELGGLDNLEQLQNHENNQIFNRAQIILKYFSCEGEDTELAPETSSNQYLFSAGGVDTTKGFNL